jgi:hypothetical protein
MHWFSDDPVARDRVAGPDDEARFESLGIAEDRRERRRLFRGPEGRLSPAAIKVNCVLAGSSVSWPVCGTGGSVGKPV